MLKGNINHLARMLQRDTNLRLIAISQEPKIDNVFDFLKAGARGFVVVPFSTQAIEQSLARVRRFSGLCIVRVLLSVYM